LWLSIEQGLLTVNATGKAGNGERRVFEVSLSPPQWDVLRATGLRSVWAIDVPEGQHQVHVASIDTATGRGGSVYLDVNVPDGDGLPPGLLIASRVLSMMPTATRVFPKGDVLTVTVPHTGPSSATAQLSNEGGTVVWDGPGTPIDKASAVKFVVPLDRVDSPVCDLTVKSSHGLGRTTIGIATGR
jgi:hypothetical protein